MQPTSQAVEAIVLKASLWGEADLRVDLLTREKGRLTGVARHARKSKIRFGPLLEPFNILSLRLKEKKGLAFLEEASLKIPLSHLADDWGRLTTAFYLIDCVRTAVPERVLEPQIFDLLGQSLCALNRGDPPREVRLFFEYRFMNLLGFRPSLKSCASCGRLEDPAYFVFKEGALFCRPCLPRGSSYVRLSLPTLETLRGVEERGRFEGVGPGALEELEQFLPRHLEYQLGRLPRAGSFLKV